MSTSEDTRAGESADPFGEPAPRERSGVGPIVLVLPLCTAILAILWSRHWRPHQGGEPPLPPEIHEGEVPGWRATRMFAGGATLLVGLAPLHEDERRQAQDRRALGERFERSEGEPYRLRIVLRASESGASAVQPPEQAVDLDLGDLRVVDTTGLALEPVVSRARAPRDGLNDPLATLLAPPFQSLGEGEEVSVVLWGRPPTDSAQLEGLGDPLRLATRPFTRSELSRSLARLERGEDE
ncbi:MAG: hypothetical protein GY711_31465 [bacterium]|nr:hypothetical protein [bacterium]